MFAVQIWPRLVPVFKSILDQSGRCHPRLPPTLPDPDGLLSERVATGTLYVYGRIYCMFTRKFTGGHGVMCTCTVLVTLGSGCSLHYKGNSKFATRFALIRQSFTIGPSLASGGLNFCFGPSKLAIRQSFFCQCNIF